MEISAMKNIFLTGAGGFLGSLILEYLLKETNNKIFLLLRRNGVPEFLKEYIKSDRICIFYGDISQEYFALSFSKYKDLSRVIDITIHCAGKTDHFGRMDDFLMNNVKCTENICDFVSNTHDKEMHFISTISVGYEYILEDKKLDERFYFEFEPSPINYYTYTKALAEKYISKRLEVIKAHVYRIGNIPFTRKLTHLPRLPLNNAFIKTLISFVKIGYAPNDEEVIFHLHCAGDLVEALLKIILYLPNKSSIYNFINQGIAAITLNKLQELLSDSIYAINLLPKQKFKTLLEEGVANKQHIMEIAYLMTYLYSSRMRNKKFNIISKLTLQHLGKMSYSWNTSNDFDFVRLIQKVEKNNV